LKDEWILSTLLEQDVPTVQVEDDLTHAVYLDCRSREEFLVSHIPQALFFKGKISDHLDLKDDTLVIYCSVGLRSESLTRELQEAGFKNVYNLSGGIFQWMNLGKSIVDADGNETECIHAYSNFWGLWIKKGVKVYGVD
jgi:rhodanese-related sulfurtransferase